MSSGGTVERQSVAVVRGNVEQILLIKSVFGFVVSVTSGPIEIERVFKKRKDALTLYDRLSHDLRARTVNSA